MKYPYWYTLSILTILVLTACGTNASSIIPQQSFDHLGKSEMMTNLPTRPSENAEILASNSLAQAGPPANSSPAFLQDLEKMVSHRRENFLADPGWLKRLTRLIILQEGQEQVIERESLVQYDQNGMVIQVIEPGGNARCSCQGGPLVAWMRTGGSLSLWEMQPEEIWKALETQAYFQGIEPGQELGLDFGFSQYARDRLAVGARLHRQTIYENCWYLGEQYNLVERNRRIEALFNPDTGKLKRLQVFDLSGKNIRLLWRIELAVEE